MEISHVSIKVSDGGHNLVTISEFASYPFDQRMKLLSSKAITFINGEGQTVPLLEGVKYTTELLRKQKVS